MHKAWLALHLCCLWVITACHGSPAIEQPAAPTARVTCPRPFELPPTLTAAGAMTIFGEIHGTREAPELFGDVVCSAAATGQRVVVGLELPSSEAGAVQAFLAMADDATITSGPFWTQPFQSGRTSTAMLGLLTELRRIIKGNPGVELFLFDIPYETEAPDRDAKMADTVFAKRAADRDAVMLLFTGNLHAQKIKGVAWDPTLVPMAYDLVSRGVDLTSLNIRNPKGTAWVCQSNDPSSCGPRGVGGSPPAPGGPVRGILLGGAAAAAGYDGVYVIPSMTASPPAMTARR